MSDVTPASDIRSRALKSLVWAYGALVSQKFLLLVSTLILARLLDPAEFGIVAFALAIVAYLTYLTDLGMGAALVQRKDASEPAVASTVFWLSITGAAVLTAVAWYIAPALARVGPDPMVEDVVRALSISFFIGALGSVQGALFQHSLDFRPLAIRQVGAGVAKGATSIALAAAGAGVWSLVAGQLVGAAIGVVLLWWGSPWRPSLVVSRAELPSLLRFGGAITALGFLAEIGRNADYVILGARTGAEALGLYYLAFRLPDMVIAAASQVSWSVLFPAYARLKDSAPEDGSGEQALASGYLRTVRLGSLVAFPMGFGLAALAAPIVVTLFGARWEEAAEPMALLAIWAAVEGVEGLPGTAYKALGRAGLMAVITVVDLLVLLPALWFAAGAGIVWVAAAHLAVRSAGLLLQSYVAARVLHVRRSATILSALPGVLVGVLAALPVYLLADVLPAGAALATGVPLGVVLYAGLLRLLFRSDLDALVGVARTLRSRGRGGA